MNSSQATGSASELPDYGLPGNDLNPNTPTPDQQKKVPFIIKVYGLLCMIDGIVTLPVVAIFLGMIAWALGADPEAISIGTDPTLPVIIVALSIVVTVINSVGLIVFAVPSSRIAAVTPGAGRICCLQPPSCSCSST